MTRILVGVLAFALGGLVTAQATNGAGKQASGEHSMQLGKFSVSLAVKDLAASKAFYEKLGFKYTGGDPAKKYAVLQNDTATIGLFQGLFPKNMLTFVPGWDRNNQPLREFDDVREIQKKLKAAGLKLEKEADEASTGPASLMLNDPDGNQINLDQYVPAPKK